MTTAEKKSIKVLQSSTFADAFRKYASRIRANLDDLKFEYDLYGETMVLENSCDFPFETFGVQDDSTFLVESNSPPPMNDLGQVCFLSCYSWSLYYLTRRIWDLHFVSSQLPSRCPLLTKLA